MLDIHTNKNEYNIICLSLTCQKEKQVEFMHMHGCILSSSFSSVSIRHGFSIFLTQNTAHRVNG